MNYSKPEKIERKGTIPQGFQKLLLPKITTGSRDQEQRIKERRQRRKKIKQNPPEYIAFHCINLENLVNRQLPRNTESLLGMCSPPELHLTILDPRYSHSHILGQTPNISKRVNPKPKIKSVNIPQFVQKKDIWNLAPWDQAMNKRNEDLNRHNGRKRIMHKKNKSIQSNNESESMGTTDQDFNFGLKAYLSESNEIIHF